MKGISSFYRRFWKAYHQNLLASLSLKLIGALVLIGVYAPIFASSKPLLVKWNGEYFSPWLRYLWFPGFYTKPIDLFFNVLMATLPGFVMAGVFCRGWTRKVLLAVLLLVQCVGSLFVCCGGIQDPCQQGELKRIRAERIRAQLIEDQPEALVLFPNGSYNWENERRYLSCYEQLGILIRAKYRLQQAQHLEKPSVAYAVNRGGSLPTLWGMEKEREAIAVQRLEKRLAILRPDYLYAVGKWEGITNSYRPYLMAMARLSHDLQWEGRRQQKECLGNHSIGVESTAIREEISALREKIEEYQQTEQILQFIRDKRSWIESESQNVHILLSPLFSTFHWEEDAGGSREMNNYIHWWQRTRGNRKDLFAALVFGMRTALVVGGLGVAIALLIGITIGLLSGYFGGTTDMVLSRLTEIWEAMPMLFILMLIVSITQVKSLLLDTILIGCFGWTGFSRYIRMETFKQRNEGYVLAAKNLCCSHYHIMVREILPNAIIPIIPLVPFSIMAMISYEAGLTFLGLGEESSSSWGNLVREGLTAFPSETSVLWPPALLLSVLLIAIALVGDGIRDALDPKLHH